MDAAVKPSNRSNADKRPGRIIVVRHGKPALDREAGPRLDWQAYREWWAQYEAGSLEAGQNCPADLLKLAEGDVTFFASMRPRAIQTAAKIAKGRKITSLSVFNEAPLPPPQWPSVWRFLPKNWNKIARFAWLLGYSGGEESAVQARERAVKATEVLVTTALDGSDVIVAAHGWFNRMLTRPLKKQGWKCVRDGGDSYWSYRLYERSR